MKKIGEFFKNLGQTKTKQTVSVEQPKELTRLEKLEMYRDKGEKNLSLLEIERDKLSDLIKSGRKDLKPRLAEIDNCIKRLQEEQFYFNQEINREHEIIRLRELREKADAEAEKNKEKFSDLEPLYKKRDELSVEIKQLEREQREWKVLVQRNTPKAQAKLDKTNERLKELQAQLVHVEGAIASEEEILNKEE